MAGMDHRVNLSLSCTAWARRLSFLLCMGGVLACEMPETEEPVGPPLKVTEAVRRGDTVEVSMTYKDGSEISVEDEGRAMAHAMGLACQETEGPIPDTTERAEGVLLLQVFCVGLLTTDETIDGSGLL